ncbi:MAG: formylglycine-generating enzyme family protein, partial [Planctomycetaceae bacterium]|nr:formylglycine-generating enzyme family protein [Planctomycetaceae bacterium]
NVVDETFREKAGFPKSPGIPEFRDGFFFTSPVRSFKPNPWGLYDLYGNVFESCLDWYGEYPTESVTDPVGPPVGQYRTNRGGSWDFLIRSARSGARSWDAPNVLDAALGFRLCIPE